MQKSRLWWGSASEVFREKVQEETDGCVLWEYALDARGYGQVRWAGRAQYTHRLACIQRNGPPPFKGAEAAHSCRSRNCMNYRHLRWATRAENCGDTVKDGSSTRGAKNYNARLTDEGVRDIRARLESGEQAQPIANDYRISRQHVYSIKAGRVWGWLK